MHSLGFYEGVEGAVDLLMARLLAFEQFPHSV